MSKIILNGIEYSNGITYEELQPLIYSDEEREVGVWRDGKPLYQKTWNFDSQLLINSNTWTNTSISNADIESIVNALGHNYNSGKLAFFDLNATADSGSYVRVLQTRNVQSGITGITLQYTKISDTAGSGTWTPSGANAVHYSTNEQVIGTWIGKPLYQKTVNFGALPSSTGSRNYSHNISNADKIWIYDGFAVNSGGTSIPLNWARPEGVITDEVGCNVTRTDIVIRVGYDRSSFNGYVTLRYTKTTD